MPKPGFFILHDAAIPDLPAGDYTFSVNHRINVTGEANDPIPQRNAHLQITSPRYVLPPDRMLSTFPPNQAQGAFSSRLPQIVLRERTLPWDRRVSADSGIPWLALVVIADGEGELRSNVPVAQCVTPGVTLSGPRDAESGTCLRVTETVLRKVFPGRDEVALLCHLREVDISDTELAMGDDDGWMAVIVANRLPRPGVRYRACLVSLEGQLGSLPLGADAAVTHLFDQTHVYPRLGEYLLEGDLEGALAFAQADGGRVRSTTHSIGRTSADAWSEANAVGTSRLAHAGYVRESRLANVQVASVGLELLHPVEAIFTFPVLAHWTFTCTEAGDFQSRMQQLNVGLQGTTPPPRQRPAPSVLATGHVRLDGISREGNPEAVWYRGPLSPRPGTRTASEAVGLVPILHVADQARRIGPDGREDVSLAVAFEIGRLLALAEPAMVSALLRWRRDAFAVRRAAVLLEGDVLVAELFRDRDLLRLPLRLGCDILLSLGVDRARVIGPRCPVLDLGREFVALDALDVTIARGFGVAIEAIDVGPPAIEVASGFDDILAGGAAGLTHLQNALERDRERLVAFADELAQGLRP